MMTCPPETFENVKDHEKKARNGEEIRVGNDMMISQNRRCMRINGEI
jgi:hypothetical protein